MTTATAAPSITLRQPLPADVAVPRGCTVIYQPGGRAREYAALAANLYTGCGHRCVYCYAPGATHKTREVFEQPATRGDDFLDRLSLDAMRFHRAGATGRVLLCFTTDPYQPLDEKLAVTRAAIQVLHFYDLDVQILTKGGSRALRDLDLMRPGDAFATTLTLLNDAESARWEPGAALPFDRIRTIQAFHRAGVTTWVSLEPVIRPADSLELIRRTASFVDLFKVGKMNYHTPPEPVDWRRFALDAIALLEELRKPYYIKADLAAYLED